MFLHAIPRWTFNARSRGEAAFAQAKLAAPLRRSGWRLVVTLLLRRQCAEPFRYTEFAIGGYLGQGTQFWTTKRRT